MIALFQLLKPMLVLETFPDQNKYLYLKQIFELVGVLSCKCGFHTISKDFYTIAE